MKEINSASAQVSMGSNELSNSAQVLAEGATEQASAVEQLTVSLEKIASQTEVNADNALKAEEYMNSTKQGAISGYEKMVNMVEATDEIQKAALAIGNVIKVIDDIAFQTNILALNANVEAARAGVHGKGFAVVADEVRSLAVRSAEAAKETSEMIENSINKAEYGAKLAQETSDSLNKIVDDVVKVAELVNDIANASRDQSSSVQQVNIGIQQVSDVVQTTSATAQECAASSEELASQSQLLSGQVKKFKLSENNTYAQDDSFSRDEVSSVLSDIKIDLDENMGKY